MAKGRSRTAGRWSGRTRRMAAITGLGLLGAPAGAHAADFEVTTHIDEQDLSCNDGDCSLRDALRLANLDDATTDLITFAASLSGQTIALNKPATTDLGPLRVTGPTTIRAEEGQVEIAAEDVDGTLFDRGVEVLLEPGEAVTLENLAVTGAGVGNGGGAGIYASGGSLTILDSTVSGNQSTAAGAGIAHSGAHLQIERSRIANNIEFTSSAGSGGGISTNGGTLAILDSEIARNKTYGDSSAGGGLVIGGGTTSATIADTTVEDNHTYGDGSEGGGIAFFGDALTVDRSTIAGNSTDGLLSTGGGIDNTGGGTLTVRNSTISGNQTDGKNSDGGGVNSIISDTRIYSSTITGNSANDASNDSGVTYGGGLYSTSDLAAPKVVNSIVAGNSAAGGYPDLVVKIGDPPELAHTLAGDLDGATISDQGGNLIGADPLLEALADNGGPTETHLPASGSPVLDAGVQTGSNGLEQRGGPRPVDDLTIPNAPGGDGSDIGSVELPYTAPRCGGAAATHVGTGGADLINGTNGRDVVVAYGGADRIFTGAGNDIVCAGGGNDSVFTAAGVDRVFGQGGGDRVFGGPGRDFLYGQRGFDRLFGNAGGDRLFGGGQLDRMYGGPGFDRAFGGPGNDRAFGNAGKDLLVGSAGRDRLFGGAGRDTLRGLGGRPDRCDGGGGNDVPGAPGCEIRISIP